MSEQPQKTIRNWEEILTRLLQKYAKSLIEMDGEPVGAAQSRADIRMLIIEIGRTFDEICEPLDADVFKKVVGLNQWERCAFIDRLAKLDKCEGDKS